MLIVKQLLVERSGRQFYYDFTVPEGQLLAIQGASGIGKTTLLEALAGYLPTTSGHISWQGKAIENLDVQQRPFSSMFQDYNLFEHLTLNANFQLALGKAKKQDWLKAAERLMIGDLLDKPASQLSGGQRQRAGLIMATLRPEPILLMDEPLSELDEVTRQRAIDWILQQKEERNRTVIMVSHQKDDIQQLADDTLNLS